MRYVVDDPFEKDAAFDREEAVAWFNAIFQTNEKIADAVVKDAGLYGVGMTKIACAGAGVALMSISHPPCAMFPEEEETQAERIARVTREMCGGSSIHTRPSPLIPRARAAPSERSIILDGHRYLASRPHVCYAHRAV